MKRLVCLFFSAVLVFSLAACGGTAKPEPANPGPAVDPKSAQQQSEPTPQSEPVENSQLENVYKIVSHNIYMDVPNWQKIEEGYSDVFILHGQKFVTITGVLDSDNPTLNEAHDLSFQEFLLGIQNYSYVNELIIEKEETMTVNGIEVYRYEGKLNCGHDTVFEAYAVGYSFVMDGIACNIIGSVIDKDQPQSEIDAMRQLVDAIMMTVRSEE